MSEPLDPITLKRLAYTEAAKQRVRVIDLPAVAPDLRTGTLHISPRPVPRAPPVKRLACYYCGRAFVLTRPGRLYCSTHCYDIARRRRAGHRPPKKPIDVTADRVLAVAAVCAVWPITQLEIMADRRHTGIVQARQAAYALVRMLRPSPVSDSDIARAFGQDHTTIMNGLRRHAERMIAEPDHAARFEAARALIRSAIP